MSEFAPKLVGARWHQRAEVAPGTTRRITLVSCKKPAWTLTAKNSSSGGDASQLFVTLSEADESAPIVQPLGVSDDGTLEAGASGLVERQTPIRAVIVTQPANADGLCIVEVWQ